MPEFECREAARYAGVTWREFTQQFDRYERAETVAHYRMHLLLDANLNDAAEQQSKREANQRKRRSGRG